MFQKPEHVGTAVNLKYFIGALYDADAILVDYQLEDALATRRQEDINMWWFSRRMLSQTYREWYHLFHGRLMREHNLNK